MSDVLWTDVGPRDGLQNLAAAVPTEVKVRLVRGLLDAGVPRVEATSFVSPRWVPQLADAAEVLGALGPGVLPRLRVLVPNLRGLELALEHGVGNVVVTIGATDSFNRRNVNRPVADSLADIERIVDRAQRASCRVDVAVSVCFGCPFEGRVAPDAVVALCAALRDRGGRCHPDGVGDGDLLDAAVRELCARLLDDGQARLSLHVHDTRGLGVANVLAGHGVGVRRFEGSVGGIGGCPFAPRSTGNVASEDAIAALHSEGAATGVDLEAYVAVATRLGEDLGMELPGRLHRAGVWQPVEAAAMRG